MDRRCHVKGCTDSKTHLHKAHPNGLAFYVCAAHLARDLAWYGDAGQHCGRCKRALAAFAVEC